MLPVFKYKLKNFPLSACNVSLPINIVHSLFFMQRRRRLLGPSPTCQTSQSFLFFLKNPLLWRQHLAWLSIILQLEAVCMTHSLTPEGLFIKSVSEMNISIAAAQGISGLTSVTLSFKAFLSSICIASGLLDWILDEELPFIRKGSLLYACIFSCFFVLLSHLVFLLSSPPAGMCFRVKHNSRLRPWSGVILQNREQGWDHVDGIVGCRSQMELVCIVWKLKWLHVVFNKRRVGIGLGEVSMMAPSLWQWSLSAVLVVSLYFGYW